MSNAISRVTQGLPRRSGHGTTTVKLAICSILNPEYDQPDTLLRYPTEIRLMIFEELLVVWPNTVFRGSIEFGPLDKKECSDELDIPWQILQTCSKYHEEAAPIMYGKNKFIFCTGEAGEPGQFWRFPISRRYMPYVTDLGVYFRADDPNEVAAKRVAHFINAATRNARNLEYFVVLASSDRFYDAECPWDIPFFDHPVCKALIRVVESRAVKHLKVRVHDGACFFPGFARFLLQTFQSRGSTEGRSITFSRSCTCPPVLHQYSNGSCSLCGWPRNDIGRKPIEEIVHPACIESSQERMSRVTSPEVTGRLTTIVEMQDDLFFLGVLPPKDDDDDDGRMEDEELMPGRLEDEYYEMLPGLTASELLLNGQASIRYRSPLKAPKVWNFRQMQITEMLKPIDYNEYFSQTFG
ncbi:hypothetical protein CC78DRAFT_183534 [Lojkania enalia]|uniref:Uncharacterized protein n=1 Tax=Lojkania enalia TaxID=147567 RepID=A0A9P4KD78_9PLEO|nr:hypothetical protein CC78DRAFT_183534 [Didymosphaeria enalia]